MAMRWSIQIKFGLGDKKILAPVDRAGLMADLLASSAKAAESRSNFVPLRLLALAISWYKPNCPNKKV
jgi:hypothetical protein